METWTPGPQSVICPKCGKEGQPVIRKQRNRMAKTPLGALCMLGFVVIFFSFFFSFIIIFKSIINHQNHNFTFFFLLRCWPFCFLPFLFRRDQYLDLHCSCCKQLIGTYDKRKSCMVQTGNAGSHASLNKCHSN
mgnify:CR=1 FL=1